MMLDNTGNLSIIFYPQIKCPTFCICHAYNFIY